jgi:hypothetical protein
MAMSKRMTGSIILYIALLTTAPAPLAAQSDSDRLRSLESQVSRLEQQLHSATGGAMFLSGVICALWAQQTRRNPWLWFFLGCFLTVLALILVLSKNAEDKKKHDVT